MNRRLFLASLFGSTVAHAAPTKTFGWYYFASASNQSDYLGIKRDALSADCPKPDGLYSFESTGEQLMSGCSADEAEQVRLDMRKVYREALGDMIVYDDDSWHCPDENGVPCQFFKDGRRRYA